MGAWFWDILIGLLLPPGGSATLGLILRQRVPSGTFFASWCTGAGFPMVANIGGHNWGMASCEGASLAAGIAAWLWWRHRRRNRAPKTYGAKTKAIIAAMVRRAREAAQPRPVLRPVPGGAR